MNHSDVANTRTLTKVSVLATAALLTLPLTGGPAQASGNDREVRASHRCATGDIKVKAKADDGRIEVEGEVDTNRRGQEWAWKMKRDGNVVARGTGRTAGPSGSFEVERKIGNPAGSDHIVFRAARSGRVCRVAVTF
ncbi:MAG TPA: hypothetical protein VFG72_09065 [Marmoricola sp.]|nr:hypothetical protein [Marmoricola sp.]